jgi:hypothetical protein
MRATRLQAATALAAITLFATAPGEARNVRASSRTSVNRNVNANRNVNVNVDRDVHVHGGYYHGGYYGGCCYNPHPVATAAAVTATAMVTAAVIGSIVHTLPAGCTSVIVNGFAYQQCGSTWYQPQISGSTTTYVVVNAPR